MTAAKAAHVSLTGSPFQAVGRAQCTDMCVMLEFVQLTENWKFCCQTGNACLAASGMRAKLVSAQASGLICGACCCEP